jgi:hypothetical protein
MAEVKPVFINSAEYGCPTVALMRGGVGEEEKRSEHIASNTCFPFHTVVSLSCLLS